MNKKWSPKHSGVQLPEAESFDWSVGQEKDKNLTPGILGVSIYTEETRLVSAPGSPDPVILRCRYWGRGDLLAKSLFWSFMAKESDWLTPKIWPDPRRKEQESPRRWEEAAPVFLQLPLHFLEHQWSKQGSEESS